MCVITKKIVGSMKNVLCISAAALLLLSCQNKNRQEYSPALIETQSEEAYQLLDTAVI